MLLKLHDLVLNMLANPDASVIDLHTAGLTAFNTSLQSEEVYKAHEKIFTNDLFKDANGLFSDTKFHNFYENAVKLYNILSNLTTLEMVKKESRVYGIDDIFAPSEKRRKFNSLVYHQITPNPDRVTTGLIRVGQIGLQTNSTSEIAQTQKVLANPREVYASGDPDWSKAIWHDSPNDSFFTDFFETRILATWDSDGMHTDPITKEKVSHKLGEPILNEYGTYFYENLDGRDIYGKQILNKLDILTTDGSSWNNYDFFDSDDIEQKSIGGTMLKNAVLVGSMFIPYVGPWIAGLNVTNQLIGLTGTLGKMFLGNTELRDTFSAMEGWGKQTNRSYAKTDYAKQNTWCWENFINLIGDVAGQLKEQRFLFEFAPAAIKGTKLINHKGISDDKIKNLVGAQEAILKKQSQITLSNAKSINDLNKTIISSTANATNAKMAVEEMVKSYQHLGEVLAKGYMTGIVVADTYGEAILAGASGLEAAALTIGYGALELSLLNTDIGKWIMPELKHLRIRQKNLMKVLATTGNQKLTSSVSKEAKKQGFKHWFNLGSKWAKADRASVTGMMTSGSLAEGVEEVSEELLADFSKSCFNLYKWLSGDNETRMHAWSNVFDRYTMSLLGGMIGGGLAAAGTSFKFRDQSIPTSQLAILEVIWYIRNNKKDELIDALQYITIADPNLSMELFTNSEGETLNKPSIDYTDSMDFQIKSAAIKLLNLIEQLLNAEGIKISDSQFLDLKTLNDWRLATLQNSPVSSLYLQNLNTLITDIASVKKNIHDLRNSKKDDSSELSEETLESIKKYEEELNNLRKLYKDYVDGKLSMEFIGASLLSMSPLLTVDLIPETVHDYARLTGNVDYSNLNETDRAKWDEKYANYKNSEYKNQIFDFSKQFIELGLQLKTYIETFSKEYEIESKNSLFELLKEIESLDLNVASYKLLYKLAGLELEQNKEDSSYSLNQLNDVFIKLLENLPEVSPEYILNPQYRIILENSIKLLKNHAFGVIKELNTKIGELSALLDEAWDEELATNIQNETTQLRNTLGYYENGVKILDRYLNKIKKLPYTNITKFISETTNIDLNDLLIKVNSILSENESDETMLFGTFIGDIKTILNKIKILRGLITAARSTSEDISLDNPSGFNLTLNQIAKNNGIKWNLLATIDEHTANIINQDLDTFALYLELARDIYNSNEGKKLTNHKYTSINKNILIYNKLKKFIIAIEDKKITEQVLAAIDNVDLLKSLSETKKFESVTDNLLLLLEKEMTIIDEKLYELFQNDSIINKNLFKDFNFYDPNPAIINRESTDFNDRGFLAYLVARASLKRSEFIKLLDTITDPKEGIAPISMQEEAVYQGVAMHLNREIGNKIFKAFNLALEENFKNVKDKESILAKFNIGVTDDISKTDLLVSYNNLYLIEGDAGTGKTSVVAKQIYAILKLLNPNLSAWNIHLDLTRANESAKKFFKGESIAKSKKALLDYIWENRIESENGTYKGGDVISGKYENGVNTLDSLKAKLKTIQDIPQVIFIDEISHFDQLELNVIEEFAKVHGITVFVFGDFEQDSLLSEYTKNNKTYTLELSRTLFKTGFKLTESMRTSNTLLDKSIRDYKIWKQNGDFTKPIRTYYHESETGLNGVKVIDSTDENLISEIEKLLNTIPETEKLTLIYYSDDSKVKKAIEDSDILRDKVESKKGNAAQGLEGTYYIIDFKFDTGILISLFQRNYYTAISRASKGALLIDNKGSVYDDATNKAINLNFESHLESTTQEIKSTIEIYQNYSQLMKILWGKLLKELNVAEIKKTTPTVQPELPAEDRVVYVDDKKVIVTSETVTDEVGNEIKDDKIKSEAQRIAERLKNEISPNENLMDEKEEANADSNDSPENIITYLLHTNNSLETGVKSIDASGKIELFDDTQYEGMHYAYRIDSLIGLIRIIKNGKINVDGIDGNQLVQLIRDIRQILFFTKDKSDILTKVFDLLKKDELFNGITDISNIEFGLVSTLYSSKNWNFADIKDNKEGIFFRHADEVSVDNDYSKYVDSEEILNKRNSKTLGAIFTIKKDDVEHRLLLPLMVLPNVDTYGSIPSNKESLIIRDIFTDPEKKTIVLKQEAVQSNASLSQPLKDLATIFLYVKNGYIKIPDESWTPANNLDNWGIQIKTKTSFNTPNGGKLEFKLKERIPIQHFTKKFKISKKIYAAVNDNNYGVKKGHLFVLMTLNPAHTYLSEQELLYEFEHGNKDIQLIKITPPKMNIETYLRKLFDIIKGESANKIGNIRTSYDILKLLYTKNYNGLSKSTYWEQIKSIITKEYLNSDHLVSALESINENNNSLRNVLNSALISLYQGTDGTLNKSKLDELVEIIGKEVSIYEGSYFENVESTSNWCAPIKLDFDGNYTINDKYFTVGAKLDTCMFAGDKSFEPILRHFAHAIGELNFDTKEFIEGTNPEDPRIRKWKLLKYPQDLINLLKNSENESETIENYIRKKNKQNNGYFCAITNSGKFVKKTFKSMNLSLDTDFRDELEFEIEGKLYKFTISDSGITVTEESVDNKLDENTPGELSAISANLTKVELFISEARELALNTNLSVTKLSNDNDFKLYTLIWALQQKPDLSDVKLKLIFNACKGTNLIIALQTVTKLKNIPGLIQNYKREDHCPTNVK